MLTAASVKNGRVLKDKVSFISKETYERVTTRGLPKKGDVLITTEAPVGEVAPFPEEMVYHITRRIMALRGDEEKIDSSFLLYTLLGMSCQKQLKACTRGSTVPRVLKTDITSLKFPLPPLSIQKSIGSFLSSVDRKIQLNHQINQTLEQMAQAVFKSWFVNFDPVKAKVAALEDGGSEEDALLAAMQAISGKSADKLARFQAEQSEHYAELRATAELFPSTMQASELGKIPEGWQCLALDEIAKYQNGLALQKFRPESENDYLPVVKIAQLRKGFADGEEKASPNINPGCIIDNGDVVFSWSGSLMVDTWCGGKAALNQHLFKVTSKSYPKWLYYHFTKHHLEEFQRIAAAKAVTMGHIKREHLRSALCAIPDSLIISAAGERLGKMLQKQVEMRLESNTLSELRDTLLPKLLSGELTIPEAEEQVAELQDVAHV